MLIPEVDRFGLERLERKIEIIEVLEKEMLEMSNGDWEILNTKRIELYQYHFHLG